MLTQSNSSSSDPIAIVPEGVEGDRKTLLVSLILRTFVGVVFFLALRTFLSITYSLPMAQRSPALTVCFIHLLG